MLAISEIDRVFYKRATKPMVSRLPLEQQSPERPS